jgi:hypothetical protein
VAASRLADPKAALSRQLCPVSSPPLVRNKIADGHHLVAVGTAPARSHTSTEEPAVPAALLPEIARRARRALVDR